MKRIQLVLWSVVALQAMAVVACDDDSGQWTGDALGGQGTGGLGTGGQQGTGGQGATAGFGGAGTGTAGGGGAMLPSGTTPPGSTDPMAPAPPVGSAPTLASASSAGTFTVESYPSPSSDLFDYATIFHPDGSGPFGVVAIAAGWTEDPLDGWGSFLASHGFISIAYHPHDTADATTVRAEQLMEALDIVVAEGAAGKPLAGRVDATRLAVLGHSLGGGGALYAAKQHGDRLRANISLTPCASEDCAFFPPVAPSFPEITIPTLILAADTDNFAQAEACGWAYYQSLTNATHRMYAEFAGSDHFVANDPGVNGNAGRYVLSWLQRYMNDDVRYEQFLVNDPMFARFEATPL